VFNQLETQQIQYDQQQQQLQSTAAISRLSELKRLKNGIQALMIENVLPQLEAETNSCWRDSVLTSCTFSLSPKSWA